MKINTWLVEFTENILNFNWNKKLLLLQHSKDGRFIFSWLYKFFWFLIIALFLLVKFVLYIFRDRSKKRGVILDWIYSFFWAVGVVLLLNQYLIQGYMIPSGSMIPTLIQQDRIFVNKLIYGPELLPGFLKLAPLRYPKRYEIVIFENPDYISRGPLFEILQRVIYMVTLSFVDINRDHNGNPKVQFLIKRLIAMPGDRMKLEAGNLKFKPAGIGTWVSNKEFRTMTNATYPDNDPPVNIREVYEIAKQYTETMYYKDEQILRLPSYPDFFDLRGVLALNREELSPAPLIAHSSYSVYKNGWYVPPERYLFLGDNRDNSLDGRYFSAVSIKKVLGKAMIIYYPFSRFRIFS